MENKSITPLMSGLIVGLLVYWFMSRRQRKTKTASVKNQTPARSKATPQKDIHQMSVEELRGMLTEAIQEDTKESYLEAGRIRDQIASMKKHKYRST
jgi:protein-arginine kinase activator protein McsA